MIHNKKRFWIELIIGLSLIFLVTALLIDVFDMTYETNNVNNYLRITGNIENERPREFIYSFFPLEIQDDFSDVTYHYKSKYGDTYAYEAYLEFTIKDTAKYQEFVSSTVDRDECRLFAYDDTFYEHTLSNEYVVCSDGFLESATFGKILFSDEKQRLIFTAIGMFDGGGTKAAELDHFLERFNLSPEDIASEVWDRETGRRQGDERQGDGSLCC